MKREQFLPWFFAVIAAIGVGFVGALILALFGIDSALYQYGFAFVLAAAAGYIVYNKIKHPKDLLK